MKAAQDVSIPKSVLGVVIFTAIAIDQGGRN